MGDGQNRDYAIEAKGIVGTKSLYGEVEDDSIVAAPGDLHIVFS